MSNDDLDFDIDDTDWDDENQEIDEDW